MSVLGMVLIALVVLSTLWLLVFLISLLLGGDGVGESIIMASQITGGMLIPISLLAGAAVLVSLIVTSGI